ncbi:unnamed protein product [Penicillium palitans]
MCISICAFQCLFYPPGWDYDRLLNGPSDDLLSLTDEQDKTLMSVLREAGLFEGLLAKIRQQDTEKRAAEEATKPQEEQLAEREPTAPYISPLKVLFRWREPEEWSDWGCVVFRAGQYGDEHEEQWAEFRQALGFDLRAGFCRVSRVPSQV